MSNAHKFSISKFPNLRTETNHPKRRTLSRLMRWLIVFIFAYLFLALQSGFGDALAVNEIRPELLFIFFAFVVAMAPIADAMWIALMLGLLADLTAPQILNQDQIVTIIGPHAIGYTLGAALIIQLRTMIYRKHPVSLALIVFLSGIATHLLAVFLMTIRWKLGQWFGLWPDFYWSPTDEMVTRFLVVLYTTMLTIPVTWLLIRLSPLFAFELHPRFLHHRR